MVSSFKTKRQNCFLHQTSANCAFHANVHISTFKVITSVPLNCSLCTKEIKVTGEGFHQSKGGKAIDLKFEKCPVSDVAGSVALFSSITNDCSQVCGNEDQPLPWSRPVSRLSSRLTGHLD